MKEIKIITYSSQRNSYNLSEERDIMKERLNSSGNKKDKISLLNHKNNNKDSFSQRKSSLKALKISDRTSSGRNRFGNGVNQIDQISHKSLRICQDSEEKEDNSAQDNSNEKVSKSYATLSNTFNYNKSHTEIKGKSIEVSFLII